MIAVAPARVEAFPADEHGAFGHQAEGPIHGSADHKGLALFHVGGLPLLENSEYFSNGWYFDPSHSANADIESIDLSGKLAESIETGALWETSGSLPRRTKPSVNEGVLESAAGAGAIARSAIAVGRPMIISLGGLALLTFLWELSASFRRPLLAILLRPSLRLRGRQ